MTSYKAKLTAVAETAPVSKFNPLMAAAGGGGDSDSASTGSTGNTYADPEFFKIAPISVLKQAMMLHANPDYVDEWLVITQLYHQNPGAWTIVSHIHQNNAEDQPHLSVYYKTTHTKPIYVYYHIYGYIKNQFIITHVTRQNKDKSIVIVAEFNTH